VRRKWIYFDDFGCMERCGLVTIPLKETYNIPYGIFYKKKYFKRIKEFYKYYSSKYLV
jgi:hypothetical protein